MSLEIDMIDVSNGDAIIVRYVGNDGRTEWVGLIDGGETKDDGMKVVQHVRRYTMKEQIDDVICSHPDSDHVGGLPTVVRNIGVGRGWIHDPSRHIDMSAVRWHWQHSYSHAARKIENAEPGVRQTARSIYPAAQRIRPARRRCARCAPSPPAADCRRPQSAPAPRVRAMPARGGSRPRRRSRDRCR